MGGSFILLLAFVEDVAPAPTPDPTPDFSGTYPCVWQGTTEHVKMKAVRHAYVAAITECWLIQNNRTVNEKVE